MAGFEGKQLPSGFAWRARHSRAPSTCDLRSGDWACTGCNSFNYNHYYYCHFCYSARVDYALYLTPSDLASIGVPMDQG